MAEPVEEFVSGGKARGWERIAPWVVAVGAVLVILFAVVILYQNHEIRQAQVELQTFTANAHSNTVQILNEHTNTLKEVADLRNEVTTLVHADGPLITAGQMALINKLTWIECAVASNNPASCGTQP